MNEFPKALYNGGDHRIVQTESEMNAAIDEGWSTDRTGQQKGDALGLAQAREKLTAAIAEFEKWNEIVKRLEAQAAAPTLSQQLDAQLAETPPAPTPPITDIKVYPGGFLTTDEHCPKGAPEVQKGLDAEAKEGKPAEKKSV